MSRVLVPLAEGFEELEAVTIIDLLRRAGVQVVVAGLGKGPVRGSCGTVIVPDAPLDAVLGETFDMVALPGGLPGATNLNADSRIHDLLRDMAAAGKYTAAICAAPKVLANAGLLRGRRATSFPGILNDSDGAELAAEAVVRDGTIVTSRGPGTAMDFALELVALLEGEATRHRVESRLQRPAGHGRTVA
jgi:4-methyl-5(b-hydroxyethyl)-thiazole monophosphate biosynthesis